MSADLEQFYEVFFEESSELLAEMETCLLGLDISSPDPEDLNAIFRAAHSIKGGAGTFGFTDMTEMTHMLESLLDKLRKGEIEIRPEMIDAFLRAGDVIKGQLGAHRGDGEADVAVAAEVGNELKLFSEQADIASAEQKEASKPPRSEEHQIQATNNTIPVAEETPSMASKTEAARFIIAFSSNGVNPKSMENLFSSLEAFGKLEKLLLSDEEQLCKLRLTTGACEEDVWEALAFVVDPSQLTIEKDLQHEPSSPAVGNNIATEPINSTVSENSEKATIDNPAQLKQSEAPYGFFPGAPAAPGDAENTEKNETVSQLPADCNTSAKPNNPQPGSKQPKSNTPSSESSSIRVSIEKVDQMINLVGELVITQAMLTQTASEVDPVLYEKLNSGMNQLERNTRDLQEAVMSIRMLPINFVFSRYPRVVRDVAAKLDKKVELKTVGEGTELDKGLIEKIADPLTHLVRNSLDHGIESPEKRIAAGKMAKGTITLRAFHQGGNIVIEVGDDGAGLNREKIMTKAKERSIAVHEGMSDQEVWMLIFEPGFSTAEQVTDVSGRGVGMDVVKRNIQSMGGRVEIDSVFGVGTRITIRLPLTLAILDGLSVAVGDQMFIVPLTYITESLQARSTDIKTVGGVGRVVHVRGDYLPVIALHEVFNIKPDSTNIEDGILVILDTEGHKAAMFVDALIGQHQVVIKSLEKNYRRVVGVSGATIMGDGKVALILDSAGLVMASQNISM
ncbi:two-component system, chemotaxis family, sensor kinase CheA [Nitrosomonas sp. Nm51]|uniref:chemotaxis protein CheW n=1 Tax=Nitrosomonas sp. Nm51 TaxID=133720 RepID=UPI0008C01779|nr:chemotaxis protein CheW [Nitrosomonas sp. Nm51]SEQ94640.1 two-component system, chemotaxis family, sensor kinase CheA [Nitrosomonas sp. Nm51]